MGLGLRYLLLRYLFFINMVFCITLTNAQLAGSYSGAVAVYEVGGFPFSMTIAADNSVTAYAHGVTLRGSLTGNTLSLTGYDADGNQIKASGNAYIGFVGFASDGTFLYFRCTNGPCTSLKERSFVGSYSGHYEDGTVSVQINPDNTVSVVAINADDGSRAYLKGTIKGNFFSVSGNVGEGKIATVKGRIGKIFFGTGTGIWFWVAQCNSGSCLNCKAGEIRYNGVCVNILSDPNNCGWISHVCKNDEICTNGKCAKQSICPIGTISCGSACCGATQTCNAEISSCTPSFCQSGKLQCGTNCIDPNTDRLNCGSCGNVCSGDKLCVDGSCVNSKLSCVSGCPPGQVCSLGRCVTPEPVRCSGTVYGNAIADWNAICVSGSCMNIDGRFNYTGNYTGNFSSVDDNGNFELSISSSGDAIGKFTSFVYGDSFTVSGSLSGSSLHMTGTAYIKGKEGSIEAVPITIDGSCAPSSCFTGQTQCGAECSDLISDNNNCGSCGHVCGSDEICMNGICSKISKCNEGETLCDDTCVDTKTDSNNCGGCGNKCKPSESCVNGICVFVPSCPFGSFACGNNCCVLPQICNQTTLSCDPPRCPETTQCGPLCIDTTNDRFNCGGCNIKCDYNETCINGKCVSITCGDRSCDSTENCSTCPQDCGSCECTTENPNLCYGKCTNIKSDSNNCGACGQMCQIGYACENGVCKGMINANCTSDSDCAQGNCIDNKCQFITCTNDSECSSTQYCNTNLNLCVDGCSSDSICRSIAGSSYVCQQSTHQCVACPEYTTYQEGLCVNESESYQPVVYQPSPKSKTSLTIRPTFSSDSSPKVLVEERKKAAFDQLFVVFSASKTRLLAYDKCLRGSLCSTSDDCCGAPCLDSRCACSTSVCITTADCCSGYCDNGKCKLPKSTSLFFLDSVSTVFSRSGCSGLIEECSPDEKTCISLCNGLYILLIASSIGLGFYLWRLFTHPVIGIGSALLPILIGIALYPFIGIIFAILLFSFVYSKSLERIQI